MNDHTTLTAADVMTRQIVSVQPEERLTRVDDLLVDRRISGVPVIKDQQLVGIISSNDFVRIPVLMDLLDGYVAQELDARSGYGNREQSASHNGNAFAGFHSRIEALTVGDVMQTQVVTCSPTDTVQQVADIMTHHKIHRIVVIDKEAPVGIIESLDLVRLLSNESGL